MSEIRVSKIRGSIIRGSEIRGSKIRGSEIRGSEIRVSEIRISSNHRELLGAIFCCHKWTGEAPDFIWGLCFQCNHQRILFLQKQLQIALYKSRTPTFDVRSWFKKKTGKAYNVFVTVYLSQFLNIELIAILLVEIYRN